VARVLDVVLHKCVGHFSSEKHVDRYQYTEKADKARSTLEDDKFCAIEATNQFITVAIMSI
jgi:hypothetical protein